MMKRSTYSKVAVRVISILIPFSVFLFTACDEPQNPNIDDMLSSDLQKDSIGEAIRFSDIEFSDDHRRVQLTAHLLHDVGDYDLMDSTKVIPRSLQQVQLLPGKFGDEDQPVITRISNPSREVLKNLDLKLLLLIDLSLPQHLIDEELNAVREIRAFYGHQGIYLAFMQGDNVSETYEATDYILANYFLHRDPSYVYLYRSILTKLIEFNDASTTIGSARHKVMVIMSDGKTYNNDTPIDPKHFELQQSLANKAQELSGHLLAYYVNFTSSTPDTDDLFSLSDDTRDANILQILCRDLKGLYMTSFNWQQMEADMLKEYHIDLSQFYITMQNPEGKLFRGNLHNLQIGFYDRSNGDLIAKGSIEFSLGTTYNPVIVGDFSIAELITGGLLTTLFILALAWFLFQFVEPYIRYRCFLRKYVIRYSGHEMSIAGQAVAETCWFCKGPFKPDDEIVVKCPHTMHRECWDENEYHCPEHGRHCREGAHYYNFHNLFDTRNALFYMKWVLTAIVAGFVSWCLFNHSDHSVYMSVIQYMHSMYHELTSTTDQSGQLTFVYGAYLSDLPSFGQTIGFVVTFFLSWFTVRRRRWIYRLAEMFFRALFASAVGTLCCLLGCLISVILHLDSSTFLIDWIPWALLSCVIFLAVTFKTRTPVRRSFLLAACAVAVLTIIMWAFVYFTPALPYLLSLLVSLIIYTVAIAVCIARQTPHSERYFLHVEGAIKDMDIALYKWLRDGTDRVITIGKSVDCSIQLSWDVNGSVAPVQAEIRRRTGSLRLCALEEGVTLDRKPLKPGREEWLYHGRRFTIGNTTFTYIEKDL